MACGMLWRLSQLLRIAAENARGDVVTSDSDWGSRESENEYMTLYVSGVGGRGGGIGGEF